MLIAACALTLAVASLDADDFSNSLPAALAADDACLTAAPGSDPACALNALQIHKQRTVAGKLVTSAKAEESAGKCLTWCKSRHCGSMTASCGDCSICKNAGSSASTCPGYCGGDRSKCQSMPTSCGKCAICTGAGMACSSYCSPTMCSQASCGGCSMCKGNGRGSSSSYSSSHTTKRPTYSSSYGSTGSSGYKPGSTGSSGYSGGWR